MENAYVRTVDMVPPEYRQRFFERFRGAMEVTAMSGATTSATVISVDSIRSWVEEAIPALSCIVDDAVRSNSKLVLIIAEDNLPIDYVRSIDRSPLN